ncbi:hypothetical protein PoB_000902200 [Plakobranchus ocellatus]|uniref:Uncharacterized protein n=1 Tax=Plakobranchus ocellatus TaxID=259542 RepID=A0AAV3YI45_9GAST|nr:hypothetical protein PoB_000902200 [Plakobranchus ocellatus]
MWAARSWKRCKTKKMVVEKAKIRTMTESFIQQSERPGVQQPRKLRVDEREAPSPDQSQGGHAHKTCPATPLKPQTKHGRNLMTHGHSLMPQSSRARRVRPRLLLACNCNNLVDSSCPNDNNYRGPIIISLPGHSDNMDGLWGEIARSRRPLTTSRDGTRYKLLGIPVKPVLSHRASVQILKSDIIILVKKHIVKALTTAGCFDDLY